MADTDPRDVLSAQVLAWAQRMAGSCAATPADLTVDERLTAAYSALSARTHRGLGTVDALEAVWCLHYRVDDSRLIRGLQRLAGHLQDTGRGDTAAALVAEVEVHRTSGADVVALLQAADRLDARP